MGKLRFNITMTLDGFIAGPNQSVKDPLGEGAEHIHDWVIKLRSWREMHGMSSGETGPSNDVVVQSLENVGATIMGRNMFGGGPGPWPTEPPWIGWWGDEPPFHHPVFVLTHYPRDPLPLEGGTTFTFVTDGIESALRQATDAAAGRDISLAGGAKAAQQYLAAGLVDEVEIHVVPLFLGGGARLFDNLGGANIGLEPVRVVEGGGVAHLKYRVVKK